MARIRGVEARAAFVDLRVQLGRALEVNAVEHLQRDQTLSGEISIAHNAGKARRLKVDLLYQTHSGNRENDTSYSCYQSIVEKTGALLFCPEAG